MAAAVAPHSSSSSSSSSSLSPSSAPTLDRVSSNSSSSGRSSRRLAAAAAASTPPEVERGSLSSSVTSAPSGIHAAAATAAGGGTGLRGSSSAKTRERDMEEEDEEAVLSVMPNAFSSSSTLGGPKAKKARQQLTLVIQPPLPRFPFLNNFFDVHVFLFDESNQVKNGEEFEFPLQARPVFGDKARTPVEKPVMEVDPCSPRLGRNGKASFRVRFTDVSMNFDNRDFRLEVSVVGGQAGLRPKDVGSNAAGAVVACASSSSCSSDKFYVAPVVSDRMTVVRHRLRIRSETQPPTVWYKDEGGRDKCIEVMVDLVDSEGRRVHGQEVPLKVALLYEDLQCVGKQDILKLSSESRQAIDHTGTATLRLRIEDETAQLAMLPTVNGGRGGRGGEGGDGEGGGVPHIAGADAAAAVAAAAGGPNLIKALSNVISWTRTVVNGLYQLQWQLIGYESKADGSPDTNKPLFQISNPNAIVASILQSYRGETMEQLRLLVQALEPKGGEERGAGGRGGGEVYGGSGSVYGEGRQRGAGGEGDAMVEQQLLERPSLPVTAISQGGPMLPPMLRGRSGLAGGEGAASAGGGPGPGGGVGGFGGGGLVPLVRESTYDLLAGMDPSWFGMDSSEPSPHAASEAQVQMVVAKEYFSDTYDTLGFPAFDSKQLLLGFYKEGRNEQGQTVAYFIPLPPQFSEVERRGVGELLKAEMGKGREGEEGAVEGGGGAVVYIVGDDLGQLKEKVLTYHWSSSSVGGERDADGDHTGSMMIDGTKCV
ncbi:hypothetical protein VYU27_003030 [Nannochloropsis oceanica]